MNESFAMNSTPASHVSTIASLPGNSLRRARGLALIAGLCATSFLLPACDSTSPSPNSSNAPGTLLTDPGTGNQFVVTPNHNGEANRIALLGAAWGRLVDIYDFDSQTNLSTLQFKDFVIGDNIASDLIDYKLDRNSITETDTLTILHPAASPAFLSALQQVDLNVQPIKKNGLNPLPSATLSAIPRNAAIVLTFDDLLDSAKITAKNVSMLTGYPPTVPYEARLIADPSHGDLIDADGDGNVEFHTTRVIIDLTVSQLEAQQSNPPLSVNSLGLPEAQVADQPNVLLRIPTRVASSIGQLTVLSNISGAGLDFGLSSPNDPVSPTLDVVRTMRSSSSDLGDPNNGFLIDDIAPRIVGVQGITLVNIAPAGGVNYLVDAVFDAASCAAQPHVGDVIRVGSSVLAVVTANGNAPAGGFITGVAVKLEVGNAASFLPGQAQYLLPFDPAGNVPAPCFVRISPTPTQLPASGVSPNSTISIRFSEPMDPASLSGMESFTVQRLPQQTPPVPGGNAQPTVPLGNTIVATTQPSLDLKEFTLTPLLPFERHLFFCPLGDLYQVSLLSGPAGPIDLSGKPITDALPPFNFQLDPNAPQTGTRGFVLNFNSQDQDNNQGPELRGQFLFNLAKGTIRPRPVTRFSAVADATQPVVGLMFPFTAPIQTPLSNLGSKMMTLYRYHDLGLGLVDDATLNIDVEGLAWTPFLGLQVDTYSRFRMALTHSKFLPDETINPLSLLPNFPLSGLVKTFDDNILPTDTLTVVHPKDRGYTVQPVDSFISSTGLLMMPYPLNRGLTKAQYTRYTWRDTGTLAVAGPNGAGADTTINAFAQGGNLPQVLYGPTKVPTVALPLLMEFRCYPDDLAVGLNGFKINIATNSSARPAFRAFSTGGILANGQLVKIDPDNQPFAQGGYTPGGASTGFGSEIDNAFYIGQVDFVVRVNRIHTVWLDTFSPGNILQFRTPITEPPNSLQPAGTQVIVALRGASGVQNGVSATVGGVLPIKSALNYDPYGDPKAASAGPPPPTTFVNFTATMLLGANGQPDPSWKTNLALLNSPPNGQVSPRNIQARITMISNPDTQLIPEISAMGIAFSYQ
ncbi:MAG TPA: Ig-like domain-containing protein [Planctomycetota bacterium]|nr:Ig-like domain-containing protein [Planctomycetota bacterium]